MTMTCPNCFKHVDEDELTDFVGEPYGVQVRCPRCKEFIPRAEFFDDNEQEMS